MAQPMNCPGKCIYCPTYNNTPQSYTPDSPAVLRAISCEYNARKQVETRLKILKEMEHPTNKVELIIMGGTFLASPVDYQYQFIKDCFDALNGIKSNNLKEAQRNNEKAIHRCIGLCIETRPDWCSNEDIDRMLEFGVTRVELGVQMLDDKIYELVGRDHKVEDVVDATKLLKENGFKVHYHWMPGLPGSNPVTDLDNSKMLFVDNRFKPDGLKLYPTMVIAGTEMEKWQAKGKYKPYDNEIMIKIVANIKAMVPKYVRISRVLRDIPAKYIVGGLKDSLRDIVGQKMSEEGISCKCIRCREYGHRAKNGWQIGEPQLTRLDYEASEGHEVFLSFEDEMETIFGLLRLRIQEKQPRRFNYCSDRVALVRELHVYGPEVSINGVGRHKISAIQHKGIGKQLIKEAERIAFKEFDAKLIAILSGVGAREYYVSDLHYILESGYMVKRLS